ncbi:MAG: alpha-L-fucosidase [Bacteroidota bacterium]
MQSKNLIYRLPVYTLAVAAILFSSCSADKKEKQKNKPAKEQQEIQFSQEKINQWKQDKLSLIVHFGAYSLFEGRWNNELIDQPAENIWAAAPISLEDYERKTREFDPQKWVANDVVNLARDIGMKRIIFNARHHDGFCLFKTTTTDFNSVDFTPFHRDLVSEMAEACRTGKMGFSLSFSLSNWHLPAAAPMSVNHNTIITENHHQTNLAQVEELLTNYGPISEIYFYSGLNTPEQSREIRKLVKHLQPDCLISNGIGNDMGDFIATEFNNFPLTTPDAPWNMMASIFEETRGFKDLDPKYDLSLKSKQKVREMVRVISSGGNYTLNIGPRNDGSLTTNEEEILKNIGRWIKVNRKAIFGVLENPFISESSSYKITRKANKLYLFVESVPSSSTIRLTGLNNKITSASFLGSGIEPDFSNKGAVNEIIWTSPAMADPMELPVIEIVFEDTIRPMPMKNIKINPGDTLTLNKNNVLTQHSISLQDRMTSVLSITALRWNLEAKHNQKAILTFPRNEKGREFLIETANGQNKIRLEGNRGHLICSRYDTIQNGDIYQSEAFYGDLKEVHINPNGSNRLRVLNTSWTNLKNKKETHLNPLPMSSIYYYLEIEAQNHQQYLYRITGNEGLQIWLNQKEINLSRNSNPGSPHVKELIFDLKKGKNILIIKNYNRLGETDYFDILPLPEAHWWEQEFSVSSNPEYLIMEPADTESPHADMDLQDFSITLTPDKAD